jgi:hypothetical protein
MRISSSRQGDCRADRQDKAGRLSARVKMAVKTILVRVGMEWNHCRADQRDIQS